MKYSDNLQNVMDYGPKPYVINISCMSEQNSFYRRTLWTGCNLQVTLMCIPPFREIGMEVHSEHDQFLCIEQGHGIAVMGPCRERMDYQYSISSEDAVFVPAGTWHNIINTGRTPLKLYSVYAPPQHPRETVHRTKAEADAKNES